MKVVFLDTTLDGSIFGGAQTYLFKVLNGLHKKGVEVHFVTKGRTARSVISKIRESGAIFHNKIWSTSLLVEDAAPKFAAWMEKLNPDAYVISVSPDVGWAVLPHLPASIATCTIGHNDADTFYDPAQHYAEFLTKAVGVSDEICRQYKSRCHIPHEKILWIPYGVEIDDRGPRESFEKVPLQLVYVGRLEEEQKRSSDLIAIIKRLRQKEINFQFKIIGNGPLYKKLETELAQEIANGFVWLTGWLNNDELMKHLRQSDIFILPSAYEGFCIALVEAMANGCCPIATDIQSGNKQLIFDGHNGFMVKVGDVDAFADRIEWLATRPSWLFAFRQKAWEVGKRFSIQTMVDSHYDCIKQMIRDAKKNPRQPNPDFPLMASCRSKHPAWLRRIKYKAKGILQIPYQERDI